MEISSEKNNEIAILLDFGISEEGYEFASNIQMAMKYAEFEMSEIVSKLDENENTLKKLTPECDKTDYILAAASGAICGLMDIFLVGKAGESAIGNITDKWFENRIMDFAKICGWDGNSDSSLSSAIKYLEKKFKIPYDQTGAGDAARQVFDLNPRNHHFKSLGHNPSLLGLFFSILDQFANTSHFVSEGELISLQEADDKFVLQGGNITAKLFCGSINWLGHLISDMSGSSTSKGRGMGIPSPLLTWTNDIIVIKRKLNISNTEFDKAINELALTIYKQGYDLRFEAAKAVPVIVNELLVRMVYSIRRLVRYFMDDQNRDRSFALMWKSCEPFSNASVKRMLTVAHGTFCLLDAGDALIQGFIQGAGTFRIDQFLMRLNIVGLGRFTISLYGEADRWIKRYHAQKKNFSLRQEKIIISDYIDGLKILSEVYDDKDLLLFTQELKESDMYIEAFEKSVLLAEKRNVPKNQILRNKSDINAYFKEGNSCENK
ncbi:hypothetical protein [Anaerococcus tetradius]|uniref:Uncharacterized protein n=1 Tax=Anaerococcus tetradius TaxID=33036 RepID=A0A133KC08_9FIRM|nr:hypothetical protein [Anaerococcus tetradius]KWZ77111.1 hypothetical protein HMPREF3200_01565 [Anaerococcus tetradius]